MPAVITCGVLALACLVIAHMARTVQLRLIDDDLAYLELLARRSERSGVRQLPDSPERQERLRSISNHRRVADYLIMAVIGLVVLNVALYAFWNLPPVLSLPLLVLLAGAAVTGVWVVRRTPGYEPAVDAVTASVAEEQQRPDRQPGKAHR